MDHLHSHTRNIHGEAVLKSMNLSVRKARTGSGIIMDFLAYSPRQIFDQLRPVLADEDTPMFMRWVVNLLLFSPESVPFKDLHESCLK